MKRSLATAGLSITERDSAVAQSRASLLTTPEQPIESFAGGINSDPATVTTRQDVLDFFGDGFATFGYAFDVGKAIHLIRNSNLTLADAKELIEGPNGLSTFFSVLGAAIDLTQKYDAIKREHDAGRDWYKELFAQSYDLLISSCISVVGTTAAISLVVTPPAAGAVFALTFITGFSYSVFGSPQVLEFARTTYQDAVDRALYINPVFYTPVLEGLSASELRTVIDYPDNQNTYVTLSDLNGHAGVLGGPSTDVIDARGLIHSIRIEGGAGRDTLYGGEGNDRISGGAGDDVIRGNGGTDILWGGIGNDTFTGGKQDDVIHGGEGTDTAVYSKSSANYDVYREASGALVVKAVDDEGLDRLYGVEFLSFAGVSRPVSDFLPVSPTPPTPPPSPPPSPPPVGDDFGAAAMTAGRIVAGGYVVGAIETRGDQDWFAIDLQAGKTYNFSMTGGSVRGFNTLSSPHLYLRDASGGLLADASPTSINSIFSYTPSSSGIYYVNAGAHGNLSTGGYVVAVSPGATQSAPGGGGGGGTSPRPLRLDLDSVEPQGAEDDGSLIFKVEYSGDLTQDINIEWEVRGTGSHATNALDFVRTSGTVTLREGHDYVYIRVTPTSDQVDEFDETFELVIRGPSGVSISDDTATGVIINDDAGRIQPGADELNISFGQATAMIKDEWYRGFINTQGDVDYFAVTLTAGETYDLIVIGDDDTSLIGGTESGFTRLSDPQATLYDANFNPIVGSFSAPINSTRIVHQFTPSQTGVFYIAVREDGGNDIGQYFVKADIRIPADDFAASTATAGRLTEGQLMLANNERSNDSDWFAVDLSAGATYSFYAIDQDVTNGDGNYLWPGFVDSLIINVRDASGNVVASAVRNPAFSNGGDLPPQVTFTAPTSGRYFMSVEGNDGSWRYLAGYDRLNPVPTGSTSFVQPASEGTDVTFTEVRDHQTSIGVNGSTLGVGGFRADNGSAGSAIRFAIDALPDEAGYAAIELYFTGTEMGTSTNVAAIAMLLGIPANAWDENSPQGGLGAMQFQSVLPPPGAIGWYRIEITDLYNAWQAGDQANNGIVLMPVNMYTPRNLFHSSDSQHAALRPRLIVQERAAQEIRGSASSDRLSGTDMADHVFGLEGDDIISGGRGADFIDGGAGSDLLDGGEGFDTVSYASSSAAVFVDRGQGLIAGGSAEGDSLINVEAVEGSGFADQLVGSIFSDTFSGGGGNDNLRGEGGDDVLTGGLGNDNMNGGAGDDVLDGGAGLDTLAGGDGVDTVSHASSATGVEIYLDSQVTWDGVTTDNLSSIENAIGSAHADYLGGDAGSNRLDGGAGNDVLDGGAGDDVLIGGLTGLDHLRGGAGVDQITYAGHATGVQVYLDNQHSWDGVTMDFLSSIEDVIGTAHADYMAGDAGSNRLEGGAGDDFLEGGAGDDILIGGLTGLDHLRGGEGVDQITYAGHATGVQIYLNNQHSWDGVTMDFLSSIENAIGSSHADYMAGNSAANRLDGGGGDDFLEGGAGDDVLIGGLTGLDHLRGGEGVDQITYAGHATGVQIYLDTEVSWDGVTMDFLSSIENVIGSSHADYMAGNASTNRLEGGAGDDFLDGGGGDDFLDGGASGLDSLRGGAGSDTVSYATSATGVEIYLDNQISWDGTTVDILSSIENVVGSAQADYIAGDAGANQIEGGGGGDVVNGGAGADVFVLRGLATDYTITAEAGGFRVTDAITGRDGSDLLTGMETLRFSDGTTMALPSEAPEVLPALVGDKDTTRPEVLPGAHDDRAKHDGSSPEVLPAVDDSFVLTGKTDLPPVMPPMDEFESRTEMEQAREQMMALARENWLNRFDDHLTLLDDWSGVGPPWRGEGWD